MTDLLRVEDLVVRFPAPGGRVVHAVESVTFGVPRGSTVAVVGESGSGKSTLARAVLCLVRPTAGRILFDGVDMGTLSGAALRRLRPRMQMVFQDPYSSLDPQFTVSRSVAEPLVVHGMGDRRAREERVAELLDLVGLDASLARRYPRTLSGGQRQRVAIARALALEPDLLVCDEPVSALDVSIQAQILNLLADLQERLDLSALVITHDLAVVSEISDIVVVMYLGHLVEVGSRRDVLGRCLHPYTAALLGAAEPSVATAGEAEHGPGERIVMRGDPASPLDPPSGCVFRTRCPRAEEICATSPPAVSGRAGHTAWCHLPLAAGAA